MTIQVTFWTMESTNCFVYAIHAASYINHRQRAPYPPVHIFTEDCTKQHRNNTMR